MPCSAGKSHGKTVFGHWHGDEACPYYTPKDASAARAKNVMAVKLSDSEEDIMPEETVVCLNAVFTDTSTNRQSHEGDYVPDKDAELCSNVVCLSTVFTATLTNRQSHRGLALTDTCCARTVAGDEWARS